MVLVAKAQEVFAVTNLATAAPHNLGSVDRIPPGEGRRFDVDGKAIAVFRSRASLVYATQAECPHRGGPLADGLIGGGVLVCPLHNFRFSLTTGEPLGNDCPSLRTYPVSLNEAGEILVETAD